MTASPVAERRPDIAGVQRRTVRLLFLTQVISGVGVAVGGSVGALLAAELAGVGLSGVAQSATVVGAALFAVPAAAIVERRGRVRRFIGLCCIFARCLPLPVATPTVRLAPLHGAIPRAPPWPASHAG